MVRSLRRDCEVCGTTLNNDLQWPEVAKVLKTLRRGKAAGRSKVTQEVLRASVHCCEDNTSAYDYVVGDTDKNVTGGNGGRRLEFAHPPNPLAKAIFELLRGMWTDTHIPKPLAVAQIVSLYKKGDALDTDNFRGLSMIETPAKLFLTLMGSRIRKALDREEILSRSQAGFRPREECIAQGVTLREICLRRKLDGQKTYIIFIDFKKAYDSVSQALLTLKMRS